MNIYVSEPQKRLILHALRCLQQRTERSLKLSDHRALDARDWHCEKFAQEELDLLIAKLEKSGG